MNNPKIFIAKWDTGTARVCVKEFFSSAKQTDINKLLKIAKSYCSDEQRIALLSDLDEIKQEKHSSTENKCIERCIEKIKAQKWGRTS